MPARLLGIAARRLTYANVMATIAVFLALGGTSYAVSQLPRNSVGTAQLKRNSVTGAKVRDGSLSGADFAAGTLLKGDAGPEGPRGMEGPVGPTGPTGPAGSVFGDADGQAQTTPETTNTAQVTARTLYVGQANSKMLVFARLDTSIASSSTCTGVSNPMLQLAVDGTVVADSAHTFDDAVASYENLVLFGRYNLTNLAVGNHSFQILAACSGGAVAPNPVPGSYNAALAFILVQ